jgi:hypothetical protein
MKIFVVLAITLVSVATFGQGTILFNTRVTGQVDAPIFRPDGTGAGAGWNAQLFLVIGSGAGAAYVALSPATTFRTTSATAAFYVVQPNEPVSCLVFRRAKLRPSSCAHGTGIAATRGLSIRCNQIPSQSRWEGYRLAEERLFQMRS